MRPQRNEEKYSRQKDIVPAERIAVYKATVIGVGAIGRQVALQLTAMGIPWLQLVDFDTVEISNLASQGYSETDLGKLKVEATAQLCIWMDSSIEIHTLAQRFRRSIEVGNVVFCAVDSIQIRQLIWGAVADKALFYCDGRMNAEVLRILTAFDSDSRYRYPKTLFAAEEAYAGPCTAKTTIYCANIAAGLMISQFTRFLRHLPVDPDLQLNLLASELSVAPSC